MIQRIFLLLLIAAALLVAVPGVSLADGSHKPPPITMVLYLESQGPAGEPAQPLLDLRDRLRSNDRLEALVFEPDSPTFILAARNANPPISLDSVSNFDTRLALAQAVDAQFALMAAPTDVGSDRMDLRLFEIAPISRSWSFVNLKAKDAAKAVASQVISAASEKPPAASIPPIAPSSIAPVKVVVPPAEPAQTQTPPANPRVQASTTIPGQAAPSAPALPTVVAPSKTTAPVDQPVPANPLLQTVPAPPKPALASPPLPQAAPASPKPAAPPQTQAQPVISVPSPPQTAQQPAPPKAVDLPPLPAQSSPPLPPPVTTAPAEASATPSSGSQTQENASPPPKLPVEQPLVTESPIAAPPPGPALNDAAMGKMAQGDTALQQSDVYGAIEFYREAVDEAPRAAEPRMRLIQAYLQAGLKDQALDEERRALMLDPNNTDLQGLLKSQSADGSLPGADLAIRQAAVSRDPNDETAWIALGDSYWNSGQPDLALQAYEKAARLKPGDVAAQAHLARLYAATSQYEKSLDALAKAGPQGYPYALRIIAARTDSLIADIESAHESFGKGDITREQFYDSLKKADGQSQALAQFVGKITPPAEYNVAYLHRRLATNLLAQATAEWLSYIETNDDQFSQQAALLQSEAAQEMKTASIAERLQSSLSAVSH